jgi:hypothetical protein
MPEARLRLAPIEGHHGRWSSIRSRSSRAGGRPVTPRPHVLRTRLALASLGWESDRFQSVLRPVTGELGVALPHNVRSRIRPGELVRAQRMARRCVVPNTAVTHCLTKYASVDRTRAFGAPHSRRSGVTCREYGVVVGNVMGWSPWSGPAPPLADVA